MKIMQKWLLALGVLVVVSCAKETLDDIATADVGGSEAVLGEPEGAIAGALSLCVSSDLADRIEQATAHITRSGEVATRSGIDEVDLVFNKIGVERFERIFPFEERFEARHRAAGLHRWYTVRFTGEEDLAEAARLLSRIEGVSTVQYKYRIVPLREGPMIPYTPRVGAETRATTMPMNDPLLAEQWHYDNRGQVASSKVGADVNLFEAWTLCTGSPDIIVAVIDEPVQYTHADLAANMWTNPHAGEDSRYGNDLHGFNFARTNKKELDWVSNYYDSDNGMWMYADHGSHVAGTIAAVNGNGKGLCGVAGGANGSGGVKIMSCQILDCNESSAYYNYDAAAQAFVYAADRGALIAQCSWGYDASSVKTQAQWLSSYSGSAEKEAIDYFIENAGTDNPASPMKGGLVIFAAGNDGHIVGDQMTWPSAYAPTIAVASIAPDYTPAYYTDFGSWVDITAPGGDMYYNDETGVLSTILDDPSMSFKDDRDNTGYGYMQGTSMACPHVSGVAALGLSYAAKLGKQFTAAEFKTMLLSSVNDINPYMTGTKRVGSKTLRLTNYSKKMGTGYVDAYKLLLEVEGTPGIYIRKGESATIDLTTYFGAGAKYASFEVTVEGDVKTRLGMSTPTVKDGKLSVVCSKAGAGTITLSTVVSSTGEPEMSKKLAIIAREFVADNGGWL